MPLYKVHLNLTIEALSLMSAKEKDITAQEAATRLCVAKMHPEHLQLVV